ncbi:metallophosphatase domain-containing protein [Engelhardtia mirabilis]|uniref:Calcineurin-like phosphoesterase n=1 Tax=Engelhardtia mirabilis TaxID=2528011 RepID=A0A518BEB1_9BACT|nr:Calcineurin-like phosphoesterase [Planctomycetes bacterium Pla133]QDU99653.1 Calcineurin-like phosphoesterase [Planctomycetes bacterium Pla86]
MRFVCLSDTHGSHDRLELPAGDVLIHAGDFTRRGTIDEVAAFAAFLRGQPHRHKLVVAGNHDFLFQEQRTLAREILGDVHYLEDSGVDLEGVSLWGSPWQPWFHDWAFNLPRGEALERVWAGAPTGVDVLITHTPPLGTLDLTRRGERVGCESLAAALPRIAPRLHLFGHIHESHGTDCRHGRLSVNASLCGRGLSLEHRPVVVDLDSDGARVVDAPA